VKGHNKFYCIRVLHKHGALFRLYTQWGRVGAANPQDNNEDLSSKYEAVLSFKKKFYDKTHNDWEDRAAFVSQPGKYTLIEVKDVGRIGKATSVNQDIQALNRRNADLAWRIHETPSALQKDVLKLLELI